MGKRSVITSIDIVMTGKRIHHAILDSGYTLKEIREMLFIKHPQPVYRWIHGYTLPSVDNLYGLSKILNVHMEDLIVEVGTVDKIADEAVDEME